MFDSEGNYWVVDIKKSAKYLTDTEFEQLQGLIKKIDLFSKNEDSI